MRGAELAVCFVQQAAAGKTGAGDTDAGISCGVTHRFASRLENGWGVGESGGEALVCGHMWVEHLHVNVCVHNV